MTGKASGGINWSLVFGTWAVVAALLLFLSILQYGTVPLHGDSDDAMRMVTATDLLRGQPWQDINQYRDNAPYGASMHWSRLLDAPLAALMAVAQPIFGTLAPDIAAMAWPLILLLPLIALSAIIVRRVLPDADQTPAVILPVIGLVVPIEFLPGRVDHHNVQILLMLLAVSALLWRRDRTDGALLAGFCFATSIAIGLETLPFIALGIIAYGLFWVVDPLRFRRPVALFGAALALATAAQLLLATPPAAYFDAACDALSITYVVATAAIGVALVLAGLFCSRLASAGTRLTVLASLGALAGATTVLLFPVCLDGPYAAVDPKIIASVFSGIAEVQPLWQRLLVDPATGIAFGLLSLVALAIGALRIVHETGERRLDWLLLTSFLGVAVVVMLFQIRGARFAAVFAIPAGAYLITIARERYLAGRSVGPMLALLGSWLLFAGTAHYVAGAIAGKLLPRAAALSGASVSSSDCLNAGDYDRLLALPRGAVMTPLRLGSRVLRYTPHAVVSAGFHRNDAGTLDVLDFFGGSETAARQIAAARELDYLVTCGAAPMALSASSWLTPLTTTEEALQIYRIGLAEAR